MPFVRARLQPCRNGTNLCGFRRWGIDFDFFRDLKSAAAHLEQQRKIKGV
jgi:hypothetical protein